MTHSAHRFGTVESLSNDYTFYARTSRWVNREGCGPKLRKILEIVLSEHPVNLGSSHSGKSLAGGLDTEAYAATLDKAYGVACTFSSKDAVRSVLKKLKEADLGVSIVVGGLIDELVPMARELGLKPHTALISLGIHGKKELLPADKVLEVTTMCGHGMVATNLALLVMEQVGRGEMAAEEGARFLAQPCPCGIFNIDRCTALLEKRQEKSAS